jgi:hypothetical protein
MLSLLVGLRQIVLRTGRVKSTNGADQVILALDELGGLDSKQRRALPYIIASLDEKLDDTAGIRRKHGCGRVVAIGNFPFGRVLGPETRQLHRHNLQVLPLCIGLAKRPRLRLGLRLCGCSVRSRRRRPAHE